MSRLDRHVAAVQSKLMFRTFLAALAWAAVVLAAAVLLVVLVDRVFNVTFSRHGLVFLIGCAACVAWALGYAVYRKPSKQAAAVAIDDVLGLKEKFSTALYVRPSVDPFALAAVKDAERAAENVSLYKRFPLQYPRQANGAIALAGAAFLSAWLLPHLDLFGRGEAQRRAVSLAQAAEQQKQAVSAEVPKVEALVHAPVSSEGIKIAQEARDLLNQKSDDPERTSRTVLSKLQDAQEALKKTADTDVKYRQAEKNEELLKGLEAAKDDGTPLGKAQDEIKNQQFDKAVQSVADAVRQFNTMDKKQQDAAVKQASTLAAALAKAANNPALQQQITSGLQQLTNNPQTAAAMAKAMTAAAQGNPQAAQQVAKLAQQVQAQMNNGQGPTAQQQQMVQKMMANMQAQANSQAQAQAMAQAAQSLAQAMQGAQQAGQQGQAQAAAQPKAGQAGAQGQSQPQPGQGSQKGQAGQPSPAGQQQNAGGPKGQNDPQQQQQVAAAQQNLQQQLQQMQAAQQDAQQMAAAQQAAQDAANQAADGAGQKPGQGGGKEGEGQQQGQANAGNQPGNGQQGGQNPGQGVGGGQNPGQANGGVRTVAAAPATFTKSIDPTQDQGKGKMLASRFVKSDIEKGEAKAELRAVAASAEKADEDDIDQDRIPKEAQKTVRDYFSNLQKD